MYNTSKNLLFLICLVILAACGTVKIGIERPPTPDLHAAATTTAQAAEYARLSTEVARLEATLGITHALTTVTPTPPAPVAGSEDGVFYQPIPLAAVANAPTDFAAPFTGPCILGGIPFELSASIFKSQSASSPGEDYPVGAFLEMDIPHPVKVHLLLNTGDGFTEFEGQVVGRVLARCGAGDILVGDLQLGRDVREWHLAYNVVYEVERAAQVWTGTLAGAPDLTGHIDLLSLALPKACQDDTLQALELIDTSADTVGSRDPALNLFGLTVEYRP
ncbi:MAG: hypothetical protein JXA21_11615 [Anaerolineae bacterium]|nr:hypothetical protein [Anaerolineae bacterium]